MAVARTRVLRLIPRFGEVWKVGVHLAREEWAALCVGCHCRQLHDLGCNMLGIAELVLLTRQ